MKKTNNMKKLNDIFKSGFWNKNFQPDLDAEQEELEAQGWTRGEIESIANSVINTEINKWD